MKFSYKISSNVKKIWNSIAPFLSMIGLVLITAAAWLSVAYVCSRKVVWFESDWDFLRQLLPGIF